MDMKTLKVGDVLVHVGNFCLSWKKELIVDTISPSENKIIGEDMRGSVEIYTAQKLDDYIKKGKG